MYVLSEVIQLQNSHIINSSQVNFPFYHRGDVFYNRYIETEVEKNYIDYDGTGVRTISQYLTFFLEAMEVIISDICPHILIEV